MSIRQGLMKACQDDARRAGERGRLLLEARRANLTRRGRVGPIAPGRRMAALLLHRAMSSQSGGRAFGAARPPKAEPAGEMVRTERFPAEGR
jgi:hypothetical protein